MPARKPAKLLLLAGRGDGKDSAGRPVPPPPAFERCAPNPPTASWFDREARAEWRRTVPELAALGLLKAPDRAVLVVWCLTWSRYVAAVKQYQRDGMLVTNPDSGNLRRHPAVGIAETAAAQLRTYAAELGLSPAGERRISAPITGDDDDNPFGR